MPHAQDDASRSSRSQAQLAYHRIRDLIVAGRLSPGARLVETALASELGVSRGAVRPALSRLLHERFAAAATSGRQVRLIVAPLTRDDALDLYFMVAELEGLAASRAAQSGDEIYQRMMVALEARHLRLEHLGGRQERRPGAFMDLDREFHGAYVAAAGSPRLLAAHRFLRPQLERYALFYSVHAVGRLEVTVREHGAIIRALGRRDPGASREAARANWRNGGERLAAVIDRVGSRGDWPGGQPVDVS